MTVDVNFVEPLENACLELRPQIKQAMVLLSHFSLSNLAGLAETDDTGDVQRARTHSALMAAAVHLRRKPYARTLGTDVNCTDPLGSVNFVRAHREQIDTIAIDINRNFANGLDSVAMEYDALFLGDTTDFGHRMNRADLVVGIHQRDQNGLVGNRRADCVRVNHAVLIDRQISDDRLAGALERTATVENRLMLGYTRDDVVALVLVKIDDALDGEVVGLGRAAGENDFLGLGVDQRRNLIA